MPSEPHNAEAALLQSMLLLASMTTATEVWQGIAERRAGRDPSGQESPLFVRTWLAEARTTLADRLLAIQSVLVAAHQEDAFALTVVRHFELLLMLHRLELHLHAIHQRLLSLYPYISEALAEEARLLHAEAPQLGHVAYRLFTEALGDFLNRAFSFAEWMHEEL